LSSACASKEEKKTESSSKPTETQAAAAPSGPTDSEIAHIVVTANTIDIDSGKLAKAKSKNKKVKEFADHMIADHTGLKKQTTELATRLGVTPKDNPGSQELMAGANDHTAFLKNQKGKAFDRSYVESEVGFHQSFLNAIDNLLVPSAKNEELKALIIKVRPAIVAHLEHAKKLQASLPK
jgi:putative membrane protein